MGRQSDFTPETANAICERLIDGESLRTICSDDDMPSTSAVCRWLGQNEQFREQYAHAREAQADTLADEILNISDAVDGDPQRDRLRVDSRKWLAGKLRPKVYGDKTTTEHTGADGGPILTETKLDASGLTDDQLRALGSIKV
jgi:hypothetical protein